MSILEKAKQQIDTLSEKVRVDPSPPKDKKRKPVKNVMPHVAISVDASDEASINFSPRSENEDYFHMTNKHGLPTNLKKVDVEVDDVEEGASDTVYGQGTNPKPEDETYLSLLKGTQKPKKIKVKISKDAKQPDPAYKNVH